MRILKKVIILSISWIVFSTINSVTFSQENLLESNKALVTRYIENRMKEGIFSSSSKSYRVEFQNLATNVENQNNLLGSNNLDMAIPDRKDIIEVIIAEGDMVGVKYRITGTHLGNLYGIPATNKTIDIYSLAFYKVINGMITESFEMADEAALLKQLGKWLPKRSDNMTVIPDNKYPVREGSQVLMDILSVPEDTDTYINKVRVSAYKSKIRPFNQIFEGRPYEVYTRAGFYHLGISGNYYGAGDQGIGPSFSHDRNDKVSLIIAEDNIVMILFLLTATDIKGLFGNKPSNNDVAAWEAGVHTFEGTHWKEGWWFGDDIGLMLQINAPPEFMIY
ncbi:MAG: hypothetical protein CMQ51_06630 [Gammaproteobacteria bacterium]|nr:hypothetical protein [Gammaproteobacteria bacterium]|tara:strand:+ start:4058 stop:5062 length:1005 start_codon:yes stop_codon:yes gene_type:complete